MRDYKKHLGRKISVQTLASGEFHGILREVGHESITIECEAYFNDVGEQGKTPGGLLIFDRFAIAFVQVK